MKKIIISIFIFVLTLSMFPVKSITALEKDSLIEKELEVAIVSGDGSLDNPYIIDSSMAPTFSEYLIDSGEQLMESLNSKPSYSSISPCVLEGILSGTNHKNQTSGGRWKRTSGGMEVIYNGSITVKQVNYIGYNDVLNLKAGFSDVTSKKIFKDIWDQIYKDPFSVAVETLINEGIKGTWAASMVKWLGFAGSAYSFGVIAAEISVFLQQKPYNDAASQKKGVIRAEYNTSYQGSWYATSLTEVWSNYPNAKEPASAYGKGQYQSGYK